MRGIVLGEGANDELTAAMGRQKRLRRDWLDL
jgi:hypothetical protein